MKHTLQISFGKPKMINMKTGTKLFLLFPCLCLMFLTTILEGQNGGVGIGTVSPDSSALLDLQSTTKGMLAPRMTTAQRNAISSPATGLMVFDTEAEGFYFFDGALWRQASLPVDGTKDEVLKSDANGYASWGPIFPSEIYPLPNPSLAGTLNPINFAVSLDLQGNYAYIISMTSKSLEVVDVSDPSNPTTVGSKSLNVTAIAGVAVQDSFAYVVNYGNNLLRVVDISDATNPDSVGSVSLGGGSWSLDVQGDYVYATLIDLSQIKIINVSNPEAPVVESTIGVASSPRYIEVSGDYAYITHENANGLTVLDISDPTMPAIVGSLSLGASPWFLAVQGNYVYVIDISDDNLKIIDVSDPSNPSVISTLSIGSDPNAIDVQGGYAYVVHNGSNDLKVIDLSDPTNPMILSSLGLGGTSNPYDIVVRDNYAYVSDVGTGSFKIIQLSNPVPVGVDMTGGLGVFTEVDGDTENELITGATLNGSNLEITDAGGTTTVDLSSIVPAETDPQVGTNTTNYLPKWNGSALVSTSSVFENGTGVGIGTTDPNVKLNVDGGSDISLSSGGYFVAGNVGGNNVGMDNNEIMARNNGATTTLYLNADGGNVTMNSSNATGNVGIGLSSPSHRLTVYSSDTETMRLYSSGTNGALARLNFGDGDFVYIDEPSDDILRIHATRVGIRKEAVTNELEVNGQASKSSAGDWLANSDERLKKNIQPLNSATNLQKLLSLQGITYEWNDDKTGSERPEGTMYGFTAQNIQKVFPELVSEDNLGYLQTAYGTYDAMYVEAIRALKKENDHLKSETAELKKRLEKLEAILLQPESSASAKSR